MKTTETPDDDLFEDHLEAARATPPEIDPDFLARLTDEAEREVLTRPRPGPREPFLQRVLEALGGWRAVAALGATVVAGLWIGVSPPATLAPSVDALWWGEADMAVYLDPALGFDDLDQEG